AAARQILLGQWPAPHRPDDTVRRADTPNRNVPPDGVTLCGKNSSASSQRPASRCIETTTTQRHTVPSLSRRRSATPWRGHDSPVLIPQGPDRPPPRNSELLAVKHTGQP